MWAKDAGLGVATKSGDHDYVIEFACKALLRCK
jgi:hypothetical protein